MYERCMAVIILHIYQGFSSLFICLLQVGSSYSHVFFPSRSRVVRIDNIEKPNVSTLKSRSEATAVVRVNRIKQKYKHKVRMLQQKCRRLQHHLTSMEDIIAQARDKNMLSQTAADHLRAVSIICNLRFSIFQLIFVTYAFLLFEKT